MTNLAAWVGRTVTARDVATPAPVSCLAATLDHAEPPWRPGEVPPLGHWLYFLPRDAQHTLAPDGHPELGDFLPPVPLPRRMWAGSQIRFHAAIPVGSTLRQVSTVSAVAEKKGRSGGLCFVTVQHEVFAGDRLCVTDLHDIVYREAVSAAPAAPPAPDEGADWRRTVHPDPMLLFRFSALTFNAHRIHYDRRYCRETEGYPGVVVHGPLTASLLMDLFLRAHPRAPVASFTFRALAPLFDTAPFELHGREEPGGAALWATGPDGETAMRATLTTG